MRLFAKSSAANAQANRLLGGGRVASGDAFRRLRIIALADELTSQVRKYCLQGSAEFLLPTYDLNRVDVSAPFGSSMMQPGTNLYLVFLTPSVYHYVRTLHESAGMTGTVIVKPWAMIASNRK